MLNISQHLADGRAYASVQLIVCLTFKSELKESGYSGEATTRARNADAVMTDWKAYISELSVNRIVYLIWWIYHARSVDSRVGLKRVSFAL